MTPSQRRSSPSSDAHARTRLISATTDLIAKSGPTSVTSRAIAAEAGANLGSITYYFGSKDELVAQSLATVARTLIEPVVDLLRDQSIDPATKMLAAMQMLQQILANNKDQLPAYVQSLAAAPVNATVRTEIQRLHRELADVLAVEMTTQRDEGSLPSWVIPESMAQLIVSLVNGVALSVTTDPSNADPPAVAAQFAQLLLAARSKAS